MKTKKRSGSRIVTFFSSIFQMRSWLDWERVQSATQYCIASFKQVFSLQKGNQTESLDEGKSFAEAASKLNISDANLLAKQKSLFRLSIMMLITALLVLGYTGYQLFYGSFHAAFLSLIIVLIALTLAFRYHFWYFQIKHRKLGCTFDEWFRQGLLGEKK